MSAERVRRALLRLSAPGAVLLPHGAAGGFAVLMNGDRRRRPLAQLSAEDVRALEADGALAPLEGGGFVLTPAGVTRARRVADGSEDAYRAQHCPIVERSIVDRDGDVRAARGHAPSQMMARLSCMKDARGAPWLNDSELRAAQRIAADWERSQAGLVRGSDWSAPPRSGAGRGASSAQEAALAARCDAGRRVADALDALAPPLRRVVIRVCVEEQGLEALERAESWPARSGRLALKLALSQLARTL